jgi:hypothetical protein
MRKFISAALLLCAASVYSYAAGIPSRGSIRGNYIEARTADVYTGPCFANAEVGLVGNLAVMGWHISEGTWHGVNLSGLSVVGVLRAHHTLGDIYESSYPVKAVLIVDSRAGLDQRAALESFAKSMAGDLLQDVVRVDFQPIAFTVKDDNVHSRVASLEAGGEAEIQTRPMEETDQLCHNEDVWYPPLIKVTHAMPAYTVAHSFNGQGLGTTWSNPYKRSAFVGTFETANQ